MDRQQPPRVRLVRPTLTQAHAKTRTPMYRIVPPAHRAGDLRAPAAITRAEYAHVGAARGLAHFGALAELYVPRLFALGLLGPGEFGIQLARGSQVGYTDQYRKVIVISTDFRPYPAVLLHELLHLSQRLHRLPFEHWMLGECSTAMLTTAVTLRIERNLPLNWEQLHDRWVSTYAGALALPIIHHALRREHLELRSFGQWLRAIHLEGPEAERVDASLEQILTPEQRVALDRSYQRMVERNGRTACSARGHQGCGHTVVDRLLLALGDEYAQFDCELEPSLAVLRDGLKLPRGGIKQLWLDEALKVF